MLAELARGGPEGMLIRKIVKLPICSEIAPSSFLVQNSHLTKLTLLISLKIAKKLDQTNTAVTFTENSKI